MSQHQYELDRTSELILVFYIIYIFLYIFLNPHPQLHLLSRIFSKIGRISPLFVTKTAMQIRERTGFQPESCGGFVPYRSASWVYAVLLTPPPARLPLGSRLSVNQATALGTGAVAQGGEAAPDCGGCVRVDASNTGIHGLLNSVGWPEELQSRPTCLIMYRRELRDKKNHVTQRCFLCSL